MSFSQDEQVRLVCGQSFFGAGNLPEKNVPRLQMLDGGTGLNFEQLFGDFLTRAGEPGAGSAALNDVLAHFYEPELLTVQGAPELYEWLCGRLRARVPEMTAPGCYPPGILLGATWNPEAVEAVGRALGAEARAYGVNVLLGTPNVNLHRDPRGGRVFEGYSEDPCLAAALAPALVRGVQSQGVAANVKHFAANNQETNRVGLDETISERALRELYYPAFEACVREGCATVMAAYNRINGVPCTENAAMLRDMLRDEWGFAGLVMSDWYAVQNPAAAVNAGCDLNMPGPVSAAPLAAALADGTLDPERLAESAERSAALARKYALPPTGQLNTEAGDAAAYTAAAEGIVMLKNSGVCPLPAEAKISLHGSLGGDLLFCGEGSARVYTDRNRRFCACLREQFFAAQTGFFDGADTFVYVLNAAGHEGRDRRSLEIPPRERRTLSALLAYADRRKMRKILILNTAGPAVFDPMPWDAVFCIFLPGMQGATALCDILTGRVSPSGHLPLTFPADLREMPTALSFPGDGLHVTYGEGIFTGYRWYGTLGRRPLYPFGYGLSYTGFALGDPEILSGTPAEGVRIAVTVRNTGKAAGKTVVQIYIADPVSHLTKPARTLAAFCKCALAPGESRTLHITLPRRAFESWDGDLHAWTLEDGFYDIIAGFSAADTAHSVRIRSDAPSPYSYGPETPVGELWEDERLHAAFCGFLRENGLPEAVAENVYCYTPQDSVRKLLARMQCPPQTVDACAELLYSLRPMKP